MARHLPRPRHGFSAIELILAVAISGILVVGLTAMIDVPNEMAANEAGDNPTIASADVSFSTLERDIRFATSAAVPSVGRLELGYADGSSVVWTYSGVRGETLRRTDSNGTVDVMRSVAAAHFGLRREKMIERQSEDQPTSTTNAVIGSFTNFALNPGFSLTATLLPGITVVSEVTQLLDIDSANRAGFYISPASLEDDDAIPTQLRVRLQRNGSDNLVVNMYEANSATRLPARGSLVASAVLWNRQIPVTLSEVVIPIAMKRKMSKDKVYFVELRSSGTGTAAKIEGKTLSRLAAAASSVNTFLRSTDSGSSFAGLVSNLNASQARFSLEGVKTAVDLSGAVVTALPPGYREVEVAVGVTFSLGLITPRGDERIEVAFPLENNLALVKR